MKKILSLLALGLTVVACQNKDLGEIGTGDPNALPVNIVFDWGTLTDDQIPLADGMRVNIFAIEPDVRDYGVDDIGCHGGRVRLIRGEDYRTLAYTYTGNNIYFRHEADRDLIEAYCNVLTRTTFARAYPDELTFAEPQGLFYTGENASCCALPGATINIAPENRIHTYTFEIRNIQGTQFIYDTRGGISGMARSFFIGQNAISTTPGTVLFNATADKVNNMIVGSFRTFGRIDDNLFTIEILYPSNMDGIMQFSWDVTGQIDDGINRHIIIDGTGIVVPDEGGSVSSGWDVILNDWADTDVDLSN